MVRDASVCTDAWYRLADGEGCVGLHLMPDVAGLGCDADSHHDGQALRLARRIQGVLQLFAGQRVE